MTSEAAKREQRALRFGLALPAAGAGAGCSASPVMNVQPAVLPAWLAAGVACGPSATVGRVTGSSPAGHGVVVATPSAASGPSMGSSGSPKRVKIVLKRGREAVPGVNSMKSARTGEDGGVQAGDHAGAGGSACRSAGAAGAGGGSSAVVRSAASGALSHSVAREGSSGGVAGSAVGVPARPGAGSAALLTPTPVVAPRDWLDVFTGGLPTGDAWLPQRALDDDLEPLPPRQRRR